VAISDEFSIDFVTKKIEYSAPSSEYTMLEMVEFLRGQWELTRGLDYVLINDVWVEVPGEWRVSGG
jgi:hypothetical protein